jgi:hypothetical protein
LDPLGKTAAVVKAFLSMLKTKTPFRQYLNNLFFMNILETMPLKYFEKSRYWDFGSKVSCGGV